MSKSENLTAEILCRWKFHRLFLVYLGFQGANFCIIILCASGIVLTMLSFYTGLQHVGCYFVNRFSRALGLMENLTPELSDNPTTRTNPIRKCATAAQQYSYRLFALSTGYCISGSNRRSDYQYVRSDTCRNGIGAYVSGYFVMDVYEIVNLQTFRDSISAQDVTTTTGNRGINDWIDIDTTGCRWKRSSWLISLLEPWCLSSGCFVHIPDNKLFIAPHII